MKKYSENMYNFGFKKEKKKLEFFMELKIVKNVSETKEKRMPNLEWNKSFHFLLVFCLFLAEKNYIII